MILGNCYKYGIRGISKSASLAMMNPSRMASLPIYRLNSTQMRAFMSASVLNRGNLDVQRLVSTQMALLNKRQKVKIALKEFRRDKILRDRGETVVNKNNEAVEIVYPSVDEIFTTIEGEMKNEVDESIDIIVKLGIDPTKTQQQVRGTVILPAGSGKDRKIAVFTSEENKEMAEESGADMLLTAQEIGELTAETINFDTLLATKDVIKLIKPFGRTIGPLGIMPNLKSGTLVDPEEMQSTIKVLKAGKIEVRNDHNALIHACIGKRRFTREQLMENLQAVVDRLRELKPDNIKPKKYIKG